MRRLSGLDAAFLSLETPNNHMHIGAMYVYDRDRRRDALSFERFRSVIESRLHLLPPFRWRLVEVPLGLHHPVWVEDPDFDLDFHLHRAVLPGPGDRRALAAYAADAMSRQLDRRHPLWEMHVIEGLEGGRVAVLSKIHHAAIDGASGAELTARLLDITPDPAETPPPEHPWRPDHVPAELRLLADAVGELGRQPLRLIGAVRDTVGTLRHVQQQRRGVGSSEDDGTEGADGKAPVSAASPPVPFRSPRTSFNAPITPHRIVAFEEFPLESLRQVRRAFGGTINDAVMAVCSGALRRYLLQRGELSAEPLVAMVPISVREPGRPIEMGNRITNMFVSLHTEIADPVDRLRAMQAATKTSKEIANAIGADTLSNWTEFAAPALAARAARLYASMRLAGRHRPLFNVTISNLPGPSFPLYSAGAKLESWYPMGPIFDGVGLNITVMSYLGTMYVGLVACRETLPELEHLARLIAEEASDMAVLATAALGTPTSAVPATKPAGSSTQARAKAAPKRSAAKRTIRATGEG